MSSKALDDKTVIGAIVEHIVPDSYGDRGMELAKHSVLTEEFGMPVYFCDPQCPWQRGTNENTNSLIRQYFPKKTDLSPHSQARLSEVATQLNERPRKTLKFKTSSHMIEKGVALLA